jgi:hypothetical protein
MMLIFDSLAQSDARESFQVISVKPGAKTMATALFSRFETCREKSVDTVNRKRMQLCLLHLSIGIAERQAKHIVI